MKYLGRTPDESRNVRDTTMPFTIHVEHEVIGGETVVEEFEGVTQFNNPPMVEGLHLSFADDRDDKKLRHGELVRGKSENG